MELFRKNMEKRCAYCAHGASISDTEVACERKGIVNAAGHCFRFAYDPLRRVPPRPAALKNDKYSAEDFRL
ncbi:MAG: hypothetical protein IKN81_03170 [Oscillospiraceae bacterium]|nr:hypothetical protein [Oscillospiraceae bacterium]